MSQIQSISKEPIYAGSDDQFVNPRDAQYGEAITSVQQRIHDLTERHGPLAGSAAVMSCSLVQAFLCGLGVSNDEERVEAGMVYAGIHNSAMEDLVAAHVLEDNAPLTPDGVEALIDLCRSSSMDMMVAAGVVERPEDDDV